MVCGKVTRIQAQAQALEQPSGGTLQAVPWVRPMWPQRSSRAVRLNVLALPATDQPSHPDILVDGKQLVLDTHPSEHTLALPLASGPPIPGSTNAETDHNVEAEVLRLQKGLSMIRAVRAAVTIVVVSALPLEAVERLRRRHPWTMASAAPCLALQMILPLIDIGTICVQIASSNNRSYSQWCHATLGQKVRDTRADQNVGSYKLCLLLTNVC